MLNPKRGSQPGKANDMSFSDEQEALKGLVTPVIRGMRLLRYIAEGGNTANHSEVGRAIDVNRVTVMRLLATLEHEGLIERLPQGGHRVGMGLLTLSASALGSVGHMEAGRRAVEQLSKALGVSAYMVVLEGHHVVYVHREMPEGGLVSHIRVGSRVPAFLTAPGRAMLAMLPDAQLKALWTAWQSEPQSAAGSPESAARQPVSFAQFIDEARADGRRGYAWSFSGYEAGINACAAAVKDIAGRPVAALSVVAPQPVFDADSGLQQRMQQSVLQAARNLTRLAGG